MAMQGHGRRRFQQLAIQRAEDPDVVVGAGGGSDDTAVGVHHFEELSDHEWNGLDPLDFFLRTKQLSLEVLLLVLDVFLLQRPCVVAVSKRI